MSWSVVRGHVKPELGRFNVGNWKVLLVGVGCERREARLLNEEKNDGSTGECGNRDKSGAVLEGVHSGCDTTF